MLFWMPVSNYPTYCCSVDVACRPHKTSALPESTRCEQWCSGNVLHRTKATEITQFLKKADCNGLRNMQDSMKDFPSFFGRESYNFKKTVTSTEVSLSGPNNVFPCFPPSPTNSSTVWNPHPKAKRGRNSIQEGTFSKSLSHWCFSY